MVVSTQRRIADEIIEDFLGLQYTTLELPPSLVFPLSVPKHLLKGKRNAEGPNAA